MISPAELVSSHCGRYAKALGINLAAENIVLICFAVDGDAAEFGGIDFHDGSGLLPKKKPFTWKGSD